MRWIFMNYRVQIAQDFAKKIMNNHIKQIILFGSVARCDDNENSDICLLIIADNEELVEDEISDEIMDILLRLGINVFFNTKKYYSFFLPLFKSNNNNYHII